MSIKTKKRINGFTYGIKIKEMKKNRYLSAHMLQKKRVKFDSDSVSILTELDDELEEIDIGIRKMYWKFHDSNNFDDY